MQAEYEKEESRSIARVADDDGDGDSRMKRESEMLYEGINP